MGKRGIVFTLGRAAGRKAWRGLSFSLGPSKKTISLSGTHCPKAGDISTALVLVASAAICFVEGNPTMESTSGKFLILFTVERGMHTDNGEHGQGLSPFCCLVQSQFTCVYTPRVSSLEAPAASSVTQELTSAIRNRQQLKHMRNGANFNVGVWKCEFVGSHPHMAL